MGLQGMINDMLERATSTWAAERRRNRDALAALASGDRWRSRVSSPRWRTAV